MQRFLLLFRSGNDSGNAAIEFALAIPFILTFIIGMMEVFTAVAVSIFLEGGLREASRYGITGAVPGGGTRQSQIEQIIANNSFGLIEAAQVELETNVYPSFSAIGDEPFTDLNNNNTYDAGEPFVDRNGNGVWDGDGGQPGLGNASEIVVYRITYFWPYLTGLLNPVLGDHLELNSTIAVKNEPF